MGTGHRSALVNNVWCDVIPFPGQGTSYCCLGKNEQIKHIILLE